ncbi:hypothetical protein E1176_07675 [Fulvivirga sp. RKSG066]|uniref:hypothetical protein n=1 Tax=Fulvivirga aurantia TaxID=2529383 RepID=UPI0012BD3A34|nr:hypothetical protein [Fulvivirga aurantia]MTI20896.1 hypothetical protein [Fulvivirga aurantia]
MRSQNKNKGYYLASGLLALVIVSFGLFDASAHIISPVQFNQAQLELILEQKDAEGEINLSTFYSWPYNKSPENYRSTFIFNTYLIGYNSSIIVKHQSQSKKLDSINPISHFIQLKRIPQNSDDPSNS